MTDATLAPPMMTAIPTRIAGIVVLLLLLLGFASIVWTPYPVNSLDVGAAMSGPGAAHWLGTDQLGRDVLSLSMKAVLTSFVVAAVAAALGALIGIPLGFAAANWGRVADLAVGGVRGYLGAVPAVATAALLACLFGPSAATAMVALGVASVAPFATATRDTARAAGRQPYVAAARLAGSSGLDLVRRHTWPMLLPAWGATAMTQLAGGVLAEAALSYVGLGVQPPAASLGLLLRDAQAVAVAKPMLLLVPGATIIVLVLCLMLVARALHATLAARAEIGAGDA
jgi:peptide/nickel transport system permease protein